MALKRKLETKSQNETKKKSNFWANSLKEDMNDPNLQIFADDQIAVIKDKYPKAKFHFLVLPKENLPNLKSLTKNHVELLQYMYRKGKEIAESCKGNNEFRYGYHAIPSMSQVHLHAISQDFVSDKLKTKKHWNSFTSEYFVDSEDLIKQIQEKGKYEGLSVEAGKRLLDQPLRCHRCNESQGNMPKLKQHLLTHLKQ